MLKKYIRKKILKIRQNKNKKNLQVRRNFIFELLKFKKFRNKIIGNYIPINFEADTFQLMKDLKKKGFKIFALNKGTNKDNFEELLKTLKRKNFSRIFLESGLKFLSFILNGNYINNLYVFKSNKNLKKYGVNNINSSFLKKIKLKRKINVNLLGDNLYKVEFNYV